jgi:Na+-transporting NADH:ubiquinone oxidoreductase subunit F
MITKIILTTLAMAGISGFLSLLLVIAERYLANYGECKIEINNKEELTVIGGSSLLSSLNSQKIFLPSACGGRGTCAYCKCKVIEGIGPLLPTEEPHLNEEEIENNIRLSCQVKVKQNIKIEIPEELFNIKEYKTQVAFIKDLTYDIKLVRLNLIEPEEISFLAGQYVQLYTQSYNNAKESVSRAYSIASPNYEKKYIELMVRLIPEGICSTWVHEQLKIGDEVKLVGPMGDFYLREGGGELIMIAGGSGMAPIVSILNDIVQKKIERKIIYFFGALSKKDLFNIEEMEKLKQQISDYTFVPALSQPDEDDVWDGETGLITEPLEEYLKDKNTIDIQVYLCGSPGMIEACVVILKKYGISEKNIFFDPFV